jgi:hypothetical protein
MRGTPDRLEMYVATLFELLAFLQVPQREVAKHFGVSAGMVSHWAHGDYPMSQHRGAAFLAFVQEAERQAIERTKALPRAAQGSTVLTGGVRPTPEEELRQKIGEYWQKWLIEIDEANGEIYHDLVNQFQVLRRYAGMDKDKLREVLNTAPGARHARTEITVTAKALLREISRLERTKPLEEGQ